MTDEKLTYEQKKKVTEEVIKAVINMARPFVDSEKWAAFIDALEETFYIKID